MKIQQKKKPVRKFPSTLRNYKPNKLPKHWRNERISGMALAFRYYLLSPIVIHCVTFFLRMFTCMSQTYYVYNQADLR